MQNNLIRKGLVFVISLLFILISLSSVYARINLESGLIETSETLDIESEFSNPYIEKKELLDRYRNHHLDRHIPYRKSTLIDGEE